MKRQPGMPRRHSHLVSFEMLKRLKRKAIIQGGLLVPWMVVSFHSLPRGRNGETMRRNPRAIGRRSVARLSHRQPPFCSGISRTPRRGATKFFLSQDGHQNQIALDRGKMQL